jgi:hypothetical protein
LPWLFRIGFVADAIVFLSDVVIAVLFYQLFRPVNVTLALVAAALRLTQTAVLGLNLLNHYVALLLLPRRRIPNDQVDVLPRCFGGLLSGAGVVSLAGSLALFLVPDRMEVITPFYVIPVVAEISVCLWLLIKGVWHPGSAVHVTTAGG